MSENLRQLYRKHLRVLKAEKEAAQRFPLIMHLLETDQMAALEIFCEAAPRNARI